MRKLFVLLFFLMLVIAAVYPFNYRDNEYINALEQTLEKVSVFEHQKCVRIDSLKRLNFVTFSPYVINKKIFEEYKSYNYDNALYFAKEMESEANRLNNEDYIIESTIARAFVYLSGGLFKESYDLLDALPNRYSSLPDDYYFTFARLLWDMADYAGEETAGLYDMQAAECILHIVAHKLPSDSSQYWYYLAALDLRQQNYQRAAARFHEALLDSKITDHDRAVYESSMAFAYYQMADPEQAFCHYVKAAIYDVCSCTHETTALRMVAQILYEQGYTDLAERYIRIAMNDATLYNARHRQVAIAQILPIIEQKQAQTKDTYQIVAIILLCVLFILLVICVVAIISLHRRNITVRHSRQTIDEMNANLLVANRLKEEMISTFIVGNSQYIANVEQYQKRIQENVTQRRYAELMTIPKNVDAHLRRIVLNKQLDETLLKLYPTFVQDFNNLLRPDEQFILKPDEILNTQMRIFALIRLGIKENDTIAEILGCSVNTVYTYKTRTILRSDLDADAFYLALMRIAAFI